ncbi:hypothetical protein Tco_0336016 [Tanacetum coccineum]
MTGESQRIDVIRAVGGDGNLSVREREVVAGLYWPIDLPGGVSFLCLNCSPRDPSVGPSTPPSYSSGPSTPQATLIRPSTPPNYSPDLQERARVLKLQALAWKDKCTKGNA